MIFCGRARTYFWLCISVAFQRLRWPKSLGLPPRWRKLCKNARRASAIQATKPRPSDSVARWSHHLQLHAVLRAVPATSAAASALVLCKLLAIQVCVPAAFDLGCHCVGTSVGCQNWCLFMRPKVVTQTMTKKHFTQLFFTHRFP